MDDPTLLSWIERGQNIAALLVAIGVAAEFVLGFMGGPARRRVDTARDTEMVRLTTESANASERAANAEKQAGSFQLQIAQANKGSSDALERAAKAEENLGNAKRDAAQASERAANAQLELGKLKTPRSLINIPKLITALEPYNGTEYTFIGVCADDECSTLLKQLDGVLLSAGWKRGKPVGGFPSIRVFGKDDSYSVPQALASGIKIRAESSDSLPDLQSRQLADLPTPVKAAVALDINLFANLVPAQPGIGEDNTVGIDPGTSKVVKISIGRKKI